MKYRKLWTDMHSNLHHEQMEALPQWYEQIKKEMDFWPIAYYPFYMRPTEYGLAVEDRLTTGWSPGIGETLRAFTQKANEDGFLCLWGYEWQGAGLTGTQCILPGQRRAAEASDAL